MRHLALALLLLAAARLPAFDAWVKITDPPYLAVFVHDLATVSGTAGGSELTEVDVSLDRYESDGTWSEYHWSTGTWQSEPTWGYFTAPRPTWTVTLPALEDGRRYRVYAWASPNDGSSDAAYAMLEIRVDKRPPTIAIAPSPVAFATSEEPVEFTGTAADSFSGVARIELSLIREADGATPGAWWNWKAARWQAAYTADASTNATGNTAWSRTMPILPLGRYRLDATAHDVAGNRAYAQRSFRIIDRTGPTLSILQPRDGTAYKTLAAVRGTAADVGGVGVDHVSVRLSRPSAAGPQYFGWTDATWTAGEPGAEQTAAASGTTTWNLLLPPLLEGAYTVWVRAYDHAGNPGPMFWDAIDFRIDRTSPVSAFSAPASGSGFSYGSAIPVSGVTSDASSTRTFITLVRLGPPWPTWWDWRRQRWTHAFWSPGVALPMAQSQWSLTTPPLGGGDYVLDALAIDQAGNVGTRIADFSVAPRQPRANQ